MSIDPEQFEGLLGHFPGEEEEALGRVLEGLVSAGSLAPLPTNLLTRLKSGSGSAAAPVAPPEPAAPAPAPIDAPVAATTAPLPKATAPVPKPSAPVPTATAPIPKASAPAETPVAATPRAPEVPTSSADPLGESGPVAESLDKILSATEDAGIGEANPEFRNLTRNISSRLPAIAPPTLDEDEDSAEAEDEEDEDLFGELMRGGDDDLGDDLGGDEDSDDDALLALGGDEDAIENDILDNDLLGSEDGDESFLAAGEAAESVVDTLSGVLGPESSLEDGDEEEEHNPFKYVDSLSDSEGNVDVEDTLGATEDYQVDESESADDGLLTDEGVDALLAGGESDVIDESQASMPGRQIEIAEGSSIDDTMTALGLDVGDDTFDFDAELSELGGEGSGDGGGFDFGPVDEDADASLVSIDDDFAPDEPEDSSAIDELASSASSAHDNVGEPTERETSAIPAAPEGDDFDLDSLVAGVTGTIPKDEAEDETPIPAIAAESDDPLTTDDLFGDIGSEYSGGGEPASGTRRYEDAFALDDSDFSMATDELLGDIMGELEDKGVNVPEALAKKAQEATKIFQKEETVKVFDTQRYREGDKAPAAKAPPAPPAKTPGIPKAVSSMPEPEIEDLFGPSDDDNLFDFGPVDEPAGPTESRVAAAAVEAEGFMESFAEDLFDAPATSELLDSGPAPTPRQTASVQDSIVPAPTTRKVDTRAADQQDTIKRPPRRPETRVASAEDAMSDAMDKPVSLSTARTMMVDRSLMEKRAKALVGVKPLSRAKVAAGLVGLIGGLSATVIYLWFGFFTGQW